MEEHKKKTRLLQQNVLPTQKSETIGFFYLYILQHIVAEV